MPDELQRPTKAARLQHQRRELARDTKEVVTSGSPARPSLWRPLRSPTFRNLLIANVVSDVGTFELKADNIEDIDPYIAHYNKNQREEAEMAYRKKMAKKTGKTVEEIVFEPRLRSIPSGAFTDLAAEMAEG